MGHSAPTQDIMMVPVNKTPLSHPHGMKKASASVLDADRPKNIRLAGILMGLAGFEPAAFAV